MKQVVFQQCTHCILDTNDTPDIVFDHEGVCNYCHEYKKVAAQKVFTGSEAQQRLNDWVQKISATGKGKNYDSIIGISGGVDSTYLAYQAKKLGLRPLAVHFDNGWNSELAVKNIENIVNRLGLDLITYVIDWDEFRDLQRAYFKASVVDIEVVTDHAIYGAMYRLAAQHGIKYILDGNNVVTESVLPPYWVFNKADHVNIKAIHKQYGTLKLKTYPFFDLKAKKYYEPVLGIQRVQLLNLMPYNKDEVKKIITQHLGWRDYGGKHYESVFTRFYQGYILPNKFGIDKRKAHLSNLICSGQITRQEALEQIAHPAYSEYLLETDREFVLKKLGFTDQEFDQYMKQPRREHTEFAVERGVFDTYPVLKILRPLVRMFKKG